MTAAPPKVSHLASKWLTDELKSFARLGNWESAVATLKQARKSSLVDLNVFHYSTAISACSRSGELSTAMGLFRDMKLNHVQPNVYTYTSLITACGKTGDVDLALRLFAEMRLAKVPPNVKTVTALITTCSRAGQWERSVRILHTAARTLQVAPNVRTYTAAIEGCRRAGVCAPALALLNEMNDPSYVVPNEVTYHTALGCCVAGRDIEVAQQIFSQMVASGCTPLPYTKDLLEQIFEGTAHKDAVKDLSVKSRKERTWLERQPDVDPVTAHQAEEE